MYHYGTIKLNLQLKFFFTFIVISTEVTEVFPMLMSLTCIGRTAVYLGSAIRKTWLRGGVHCFFLHIFRSVQWSCIHERHRQICDNKCVWQRIIIAIKYLLFCMRSWRNIYSVGNWLHRSTARPIQLLSTFYECVSPYIYCHVHCLFMWFESA